MTRTLSLILLAFLNPLLALAAPPPPISWQAALGTHKALAREDRFFGTPRGWPERSSAGFDSEVTAEKPADIPVVIGRFSGQPRQFDFEGRVEVDKLRAGPKNPAGRGRDFVFGPTGADTAIDEDDQPKGAPRALQSVRARTPDFLYKLREAEAAGVDVVWLTGQLNPRQTAKVAHLMVDKGSAFKDQLYALVKATHTGEFAQRKNRIFFEIGNEVNAPDRFSVRDHGDEFAKPANADDYVEYYLAPAVEAIRTASAEIYGDPRRIPIVCGNVSGILKGRSRAFLDRMLNTVIRGEHAPTLSGKRAADVVDIVAVHYSGGDQALLAGLYEKWVARGPAQSLWSTEELGWRGLGDYTVALVAFRWLDFHARNPSPLTARLQFWGDRTAHQGTLTRGDAIQRQLGGFLRDYPLTALTEPKDLALRTGSDFEWYALRAAAPAGETRFALLFHPYPTGQASLGWIKLKVPATAPGTLVSCEAFLLPREKEAAPISVKSKQTDEGVFVHFGNWEVRPTELVLVQIVVRPSAP